MIKYKLKIRNNKEEMIYRRKNAFPPESVKDIIIDEIGFKEIKACSALKIEKLICICPFCNKEYYNKHGLLTHISKMHPDEKYRIFGKGK
jgi:uncharacterized Zn-finger protein